MSFVDALYGELRGEAEQATVATLTMGLGYTAVETTTGDVGLSYTMKEPSATCTRVPDYRDYEGRAADELLDLLRSDHSLERSIGLATANAVNRAAALALPADDKDGFVRAFGVGKGTRVAMIGFFGPVVAQLQTLGVDLQILDRDRGMGDERRFPAMLTSWPELLIITATTILNDSFERLVGAVGGRARVFVLGPSTPMVPAAYRGLRVDRLGGMVPTDGARVIAAARQGGGTPQLSRFCRKVTYVFDWT